MSFAILIRHFREEFVWHVLNPEECLTRNYGLAHYAVAPVKAGITIGYFALFAKIFVFFAILIRHFRDEFEWHVLNPEECLVRN